VFINEFIPAFYSHAMDGGEAPEMTLNDEVADYLDGAAREEFFDYLSTK
jgi:hypothetical protein